MGIRTRLIAAAMTGLMLTAAVGTASAASPATPAASDGKKPDADAILAKVAASLNVSVKQLTTALTNLKQALAKGTDKDKAVAAFAKELKVSVAQAQEALRALEGDKEPGPGKDNVPPQAIKLLAAELRISEDRARQVFKDLEKVKARGDAILTDPAFVAIAKGLGLTPRRLLDVLVKVKQEIGKGEEKPKDKAPSGSSAT